jgi:hypothetical protein
LSYPLPLFQCDRGDYLFTVCTKQYCVSRDFWVPEKLVSLETLFASVAVLQFLFHYATPYSSVVIIGLGNFGAGSVGSSGNAGSDGITIVGSGGSIGNDITGKLGRDGSCQLDPGPPFPNFGRVILGSAGRLGSDGSEGSTIVGSGGKIGSESAGKLGRDGSVQFEPGPPFPNLGSVIEGNVGKLGRVGRDGSTIVGSGGKIGSSGIGTWLR